MNELLKKYASVILKSCLKVEKNQPLFISANYERVDFVRILANVAYEIGVKDIYFDLTDVQLKHDALKNLEYEELKKLSFWNKQMWNEYAKKGAAFVMLASENPGLMKDIDSKVLSDLTIYAYETRKEFDDLRDKAMVPWCIAAVPTESWANQLFPNSNNALEELWNKIFEICNINEENPEEIWNKKTELLSNRCKKLNEYNFKTLKYTNSIGTNFTIDLPTNHIWESGNSKLANGKEVLVNFPTEEVFTSPHCDTANGIVYSGKPLAYQDNIIDNFWIEFKNGEAINWDAKEGAEVLGNLITSCKGANKLGEVALVEYDSSISQSGIVFYETLYDENAACHLALGGSFAECIKDGTGKKTEELEKEGLNNCTNHVDFMIGTKDLNITGITQEGKEITIFENGNFSETFK
ncbi:MAG: aminopeptidase [Firmicutes bacterium]|nr:aminopeptidase [Bacillota bacterium]